MALIYEARILRFACDHSYLSHPRQRRRKPDLVCGIMDLHSEALMEEAFDAERYYRFSTVSHCIG